MLLLLFLINLLILFIYFWLCWVFVAACRLSLATVSRGYSSLQCAGFSVQWLLAVASRSGFSCCGAWALGARASVVVARGLSSCGSWGLERRLSSCGAWVQLLRGMWDLPRPGLEPICPALAGGFLTIAPPGKSQVNVILK